MSQCIFCKIIAGEEPASIIYQDTDFVILMDAYPLTDCHILIIPKRHLQYLGELTDELHSSLFKLAQRAMNALEQSGLGGSGTNLLINDGKSANQTVPHLHLHIIPRRKGDLIQSVPKLLLHVSGLFGLRKSRKKLDAQAAHIASYF